MIEILKYSITTLIILLMSSISYAENIDKCLSYFITQPFTSISNPTYDSKEYIMAIDEPNVTVSSSFLESKSPNWFTKLNLQKDSSQVLSNLLARSDISMDEALYIITSSIIPTLSEFKNTDVQSYQSHFLELLADVLGLKDAVILIGDIQRYNQEFTKILKLWNPKGFKRVSTAIDKLTGIIRTTRRSMISQKVVEAFRKNEEIFVRVKDPRTRSMKTIFLSKKLRKEINSEDMDIVPKQVLKEISKSIKFKSLTKVLNIDEEEIFKIIVQGLLIQYFPSVENEIDDGFDSYCWYRYFDILRIKTLQIIGNLLQSYIHLQAVIENYSGNSSFLIDNKATFLKEIDRVIKILKNLHTSINRFRIQDVRIDISDMPLFSLFKFVLPDKESYWEFSSHDIYLRLLRKVPIPLMSKYKLFDNPDFLTTAATGITNTLYTNLKASYDSILIDRSSLSHVYDYFTDFSYLRAEDYQTYLSKKYGKAFKKALIEATHK